MVKRSQRTIAVHLDGFLDEVIRVPRNLNKNCFVTDESMVL